MTDTAFARKLPADYLERVYAGWLGKVIGVRHGGNVEGWSYEQIARTFGEITHYVHHFKNFAADDDTNGPMFFIRALEDYTHTGEITPAQMGLTWLNYAPDRHGFLWWGGYGKVTEQTAYLNLKHGLDAPRSGSIEQNGEMIAEQIGGQIFIDVWGLIAPGKPRLAAEYAEKIASVSHDGNGKYGGMFIAACIAAAFREREIRNIIAEGLAVIPQTCEYSRMVHAVIDFHERHPDNWRDCFGFVREHFGYHLYPGGCHIIPNAAIVVLSLLYGAGDFSRAINICNMCGWDTDCNVGNVGTIMGVRNGLEGIDASWREPINDFLCCSSAVGSLNQLDLPWCAAYIAQFGYKINGEPVPAPIAGVLDRTKPRFHFELPGSTHAFRTDAGDASGVSGYVSNAKGISASGERSLKVVFDKAAGGRGYRAYHQTYYRPHDFNDSRYDPSFSPIVYPGQTVEARVMSPAENPFALLARLYVKDANSGARLYGDKVRLSAGQWEPLRYDIPPMDNVCIEEAGVEWIPEGGGGILVAYVDDFHLYGKPDYRIDFRRERPEFWHVDHVEVSQFACYRGFWLLENGELSGSYYGESAECYSGELGWRDYTFEAVLVPRLGDHHNIQFRVQGGIRSYAAGLAPDGTVRLYKNERGYRTLASAAFAWDLKREYKLKVEAIGNRFRIYVNDAPAIDHTDLDDPYLHGMIGFSTFAGSHTHYLRFGVKAH